MGDRDAVLVGRQASVDRVRTAITGAFPGTGRLLLIDGEAGIGKTRIASAAVAIAQEAGFDVARGRALELERHRPFGVIVDALAIGARSADPRRAAVAHLLQEQGSADVVAGPAHQFRVVTSLVDLVESLTVDRPMLLILEDLHWADSSTLLVARALGIRLDALRVVLLATFRPVPRSPELQAFLAEFSPRAIQERLDPLGREDVVELVTSLLGCVPSPDLIRLVGKAGGNPLFVTELVHGLRDQEAIRLTQEGATVVRNDLPVISTVMNAILERLRMVPSGVTHALRVASVLGTTFSMADLSLVARQSAFDLLEPLEEARRAGLLGEDGVRLRFRHDLVREALYESMPIAVRGALHRAAGEALGAAGAPLSQVAEHMTLGATRGDAVAARWLMQAGREAMSQSPDSAVHLLQRALVLEPPPRLRDEIVAELVVANLWCGRSAEAASHAERVLAAPAPASLHTRVRLSLIHAMWLEGHWDGALSVAMTRCASASVGDAERGRLLAETSLARVYLDGPAAGAQQASEALALGEASGDDVSVCVALTALAICAYFDGRFFDAVALGERAMAVADRSETDEARRRHPYFVLGLAYVGADRFGDAEAIHRQGRTVGEQLGTAWDAAWYQAAAAGRAWFSGDWDDAGAEGEAALAMADETGTYLGRAYASSILGLVALHRGDATVGRQRWRQAEEAITVSGRQIGSDWVPWLGALVAEAEGRPDEALAQLLVARERFARTGMAMSQLRIAADLVRLAVQLRERGEAERMADACEQVTSRAQPPSALGLVLRCRGLARGDVELLLRAVSQYRESPRKLERAAAMEDAGRALGETGRLAEAVPLLEEALEAYGHAAAAVDEARTLAQLRTFGVHKGRRGKRGRPAFGWDSLTRTELRVVRLVALGDSNPSIAGKLYISRHTVETHLRHILMKLGVSSRVEIAAEAARRGHSMTR